jgi:hypothetical protein
MSVLFVDDFLDGFGAWPLAYIPYGGPDFGELLAVAQTGGHGDAGVDDVQLKALIEAAPPDGADSWELINWADAKMAEAILRSERPADELPNLLAAYERAWRHVGSLVKLNRRSSRSSSTRAFSPLARWAQSRSETASGRWPLRSALEG